MKQKSVRPRKGKTNVRRRAAKPAPGSSAKQSFNVKGSLNTAIGHFYGGRAAEAAGLCREILGVDPKNANACYLLGVILHQTGQTRDAIEMISRSVEQEPKNSEAHNYLGIVLAGAERQQEAEKNFRRATEWNPKFPEAHNNLGNVLRHLGRLEEAAASFREALALRPGYVEACNGLGCTLKDLGRLEEAAASIGKAIAGDGKHHEARYNLGDILCDLGRYGEAVESLRKAIGIKPDYGEAHLKLGYALQSQGRLSEAIAQFREAIEISQDSAGAYYNLAMALGAIDSTGEAAAEFENALRLCKIPELKAKILLGLSQLPPSVTKAEILTPIEELGNQGPDTVKREAVGQFHHNLAFARAGALDGKGRYEEAWKGFVEANHEVNSVYAKVWPREQTNLDDALKRGRGWTRRAQGPDSESRELPIPLYILGPSRSGKSTLEKLAGSLEGVKCGYEGHIVSNSVRSTSHDAGIMTPASLAELPGEHGAAFLAHYEDDLARTAGGAKVLTNTNQAYIRDVGWLARMVPATRFVFVERNGEDTALRIFMKLFQEDTNHYAYDMENIFSYLSWYRQLYDVWEAKLGDVILRLSYEDMIADPEQARQKLAAFCGLETPAAGAPPLGDDREAAAPYREFLK